MYGEWGGDNKLGVVAHAFNYKIQEAEAGKALSLRPGWITTMSYKTTRAHNRLALKYIQTHKPSGKKKNKNHKSSNAKRFPNM